MFKKMLLAAAVFALFVTGNAIADVNFGLQGDWSKTDGRDNGDWGVGARLDFGGAFRGIVAFDYFFVDAGDIFDDDDDFTEDDLDLGFWEVNANVAYQFPTEGIHPYLGGGVGFARRKFDLLDVFNDEQTELGLNVLGGLKFGESVQPFVEFRGTFYPDDNDPDIGDDFPDFGDRVRFGDRFVISAGLLF